MRVWQWMHHQQHIAIPHLLLNVLKLNIIYAFFTFIYIYIYIDTFNPVHWASLAIYLQENRKADIPTIYSDINSNNQYKHGRLLS